MYFVFIDLFLKQASMGVS